LHIFRDSVIVTEEQRQEKYLESIRKIREQDEQIEEKNDILSKTSNEQSDEMLDIFSNLQKNYSFEEIVWLMVVLSFVFFIIFL
jgi:uncharacterized protein (UPF0305 family)